MKRTFYFCSYLLVITTFFSTSLQQCMKPSPPMSLFEKMMREGQERARREFDAAASARYLRGLRQQQKLATTKGEQQQLHQALSQQAVKEQIQRAHNLKEKASQARERAQQAREKATAAQEKADNNPKDKQAQREAREAQKAATQAEKDAQEAEKTVQVATEKAATAQAQFTQQQQKKSPIAATKPDNKATTTKAVASKVALANKELPKNTPATAAKGSTQKDASAKQGAYTKQQTQQPSYHTYKTADGSTVRVPTQPEKKNLSAVAADIFISSQEVARDVVQAGGPAAIPIAAAVAVGTAAYLGTKHGLGSLKDNIKGAWKSLWNKPLERSKWGQLQIKMEQENKEYIRTTGAQYITRIERTKDGTLVAATYLATEQDVLRGTERFIDSKVVDPTTGTPQVGTITYIGVTNPFNIFATIQKASANQQQPPKQDKKQKDSNPNQAPRDPKKDGKKPGIVAGVAIKAVEEQDKLREGFTSATQRLGSFTKEAIEKGVEYALKDSKFIHIFKKEGHKFKPLLDKIGTEEKTIRAILTHAKNKLPHEGLFYDLPVKIEGFVVYIRGMVIDGIPKLGTMFIPKDL